MERQIAEAFERGFRVGFENHSNGMITTDQCSLKRRVSKAQVLLSEAPCRT